MEKDPNTPRQNLTKTTEEPNKSYLSGLLDHIFNESNNCLYVKDELGRYLLANKTIASLYNTTPQEMIGKTDEDFIRQNSLKPLEAKYFRKIDDQARKTKEKQRVQIEEFTTKNGEKKYFQTTKIPIDYQNKKGCIFGISVDITKQKKTEDELKYMRDKLKLAMESASQGKWEWDLTTDEVSFDDVGLSMLGYQAGEVQQKGNWWMNRIHPEDKNKVQTAFKSYIEGKNTSYSIEFRIKTKQSDYIWIASTCKILKRNKDNSPKILVGIHQDITSRKRVEEALLTKEETFNKIAENIDEIFWIYSSTMTELCYISPAYEKIWGKSTQSLKEEPLSWLDSVCEEDYDLVTSYLEKMAQGDFKNNAFVEFRIQRPDGDIRWLRGKGRPIRDKEGTVKEIAGIIEDITSLKTTQKELEATTAKFKKLFQASLDPIFVHDLKGNFLEANDFALEKYHISSEQLFSMHPWDFDIPDNKEIVQNRLEKLTENGFVDFETTHQDTQGNTFAVHVTSALVNLGEQTVAFSMCRDVSAQRKYEQNLLDTNKKLESIINTSPSAIIVVDYKGHIQKWSKAAEKIFGWNEQEVLGSFNPTVPEKLKEIYLQTIKESHTNLDLNVTKKDGETVFVQLSTAPLISENGEFFGAIGIMTDVTYKKHSEKLLKESQRKYKEIFEGSRDGYVMVDTEGRIIDANKSFCTITGYSLNELKQLENFYEITPEKWREWEQKEIWEHRLLTEGYSGIYEKEYITKNGTIIPVELQSYVAYDENNNISYLWGVARDITERKEKEEQIKQQNKELKKIDKLKSDFLNVTSHELRTPMTAIKGYLEMIISETLGKPTEEQKNALEIVLRNTDRLDALVEDILDTSRLESGTMKFIPKETQLDTMIQEVKETLQELFKTKDIKITTSVEANLPTLVIDDDRIKQVFINLLNNAVKFSPQHSKINISAKRQEDSVLFQIADQGKGIPKKDANKIFEVFYQVDSGIDRSFGGTGLGLTICRGIILGHGGDIWVESEVDKGSTFNFTLPLKPILDVEGTFKKIDVFNMEKNKESIVEKRE